MMQCSRALTECSLLLFQKFSIQHDQDELVDSSSDSQKSVADLSFAAGLNEDPK